LVRRRRAAAVRPGHEVRPGGGLAVRARAAGRRGPHHRDHRPRRAPKDSHDVDYEAHTDIVGGEEKIKKVGPTFGGDLEGLREWRVRRGIWRDMQNGGSFRDPAGIDFLHSNSKFWSRGPCRGPLELLSREAISRQFAPQKWIVNASMVYYLLLMRVRSDCQGKWMIKW
jgi:hypothetical protein